MFDNLVTSLIQAVGFFAIFGFFVYQTLFLESSSKTSQINSRKKKIIEPKISDKKMFLRRLFNRKPKPIKEEIRTRKKGWFK